MIGTTVTLNAHEIKLVRYLAKLRYETARKAGVVDRKQGEQSWQETDEQGLAGEMAYCKMFNLYPDLDVSPRSGSYDVIDQYGLTTDVKTTKYSNGRLLATLKKNPDVDYYALMTGEMPTFTFRGEVNYLDLIDEANIIDLGHGQGYGLSQDKVRKLSVVE